MEFPKFQHIKNASVLAQSGLCENDWTPALNQNCYANEDHHRPEERDPGQRGNKVKQALRTIANARSSVIEGIRFTHCGTHA